MASLVANPVTVGFWSANDSGTTVLTWSGDAGGNASVSLYRSDNGAAETKLAGPALNGVTTDATLKLGHTYTYILRAASTNAPLATVTVTTFDANKSPIVSVVSDHLWQFIRPSQQLFDIRIVPGVDSARLTFKTSQETVPVITITPKGGTPFTWVAFFGGAKTRHEYVLGSSTPLAQNKSHTIHISVSGKDSYGAPMTTSASATFKTGFRNVTVILDRLKVLDDSDDAGDGEIMFSFGAGNADSGELLAKDFRDRADINDDDPAIDLNKSLDVPNAPRSLWVQINGHDSDASLWNAPWVGLGIVGMLPHFTGEGSWFEVTQGYDYSNVTSVFDLSDITSPTELPAEIATGAFKLNFTVSARIKVDAFVPPPITSRKPQVAFPLPKYDLSVVGSIKQAGHMSGGKSHLMALGADGAVYYKPATQPDRDPRDENWTRLGEPVAGPVKALPRRDGALALFASDEKGNLVWQVARDNGREARWLPLGPHFSETAVTEGPRGDIEVFGLGDDGIVYHQTIPPDGKGRRNDWQRVGSSVAGSLTAECFADGTIGLFAVGANGQVLHKQRRRSRWMPAALDFDHLGKATGPLLRVLRPVAQKGVLLATYSRRGEVSYLAWPSYPEGTPPHRWISMGTIEAWLAHQPERQPETMEKSAKPTASAVAPQSKGIGGADRTKRAASRRAKIGRHRPRQVPTPAHRINGSRGRSA